LGGTGIYQQDENTGQMVCGTQKAATFDLPFIFALIGWLNTLINPIIYAVRNRDLRRAFRKMINGIFVGIPSSMFSSVRDLC
jgi:hypothetical protein